MQVAANRLLGSQGPVEVRSVRVPVRLLGRLQFPEPFESESHVADLVAMNRTQNRRTLRVAHLLKKTFEFERVVEIASLVGLKLAAFPSVTKAAVPKNPD